MAVKELIEKAKKLGRSVLDARGREVLDPTPIEVPVDTPKYEPLDVKIARIIQSGEFRRELQARDLETPEEFEDFGEDDDLEEPTVHEQMASALDEIEDRYYQKQIALHKEKEAETARKKEELDRGLFYKLREKFEKPAAAAAGAEQAQADAKQ